MNDFIFALILMFKELLKNSFFTTLIGIIVSGFISFRVAKYSATKPNKLEIKQKQLEFVYLPLYRLFEKMPKEFTIETCREYSKILSSILDKHYVYVFPTLHNLNQQLSKALSDNKDVTKIFKSIKYQIDVDYELLKKSLGYPSVKWYAIFIRMTLKQKLELIISWINIFVIILLPVFSIQISTDYSILFAMIFLTVSFAFLILINKLVTNIKD